MNSWKEDKLDFKQIVLEHLKKILVLSSEELRNKTYIEEIGNGNFSSFRKHYDEDLRKSYLQSVEHFAMILMPYFDEKAKEVYDETIEIMNFNNFEVMIKFKEEFKKLSELYKKEITDFKEMSKSNYCYKKKLSSAKKLFAELNMLLKRNDYLSSSVYVEEETQ